ERAVPDRRTRLGGSVAVTLSARMRSVCPSCCRGDRRSTMDLDPVLLSRLQFAWVIGWHILLPAFTVGMASYIAILEGMHLVTGRSVYLRISMYWIRIFSVAFGVGVVTGVIMPFQIGTNWSRYADTAGNVLGPLFAYEGVDRLLPGSGIP